MLILNFNYSIPFLMRLRKVKKIQILYRIMIFSTLSQVALIFKYKEFKQLLNKRILIVKS